MSDVDWDEFVLDVIAHYATGEYGNTVEFKNDELCVRALIRVHNDMVKIELYNIFDKRSYGPPFFRKTINYANPDCLDGRLTKEINESINQLTPLILSDGTRIG
ncbi:MAG: hypothetical protein GF411_08645 [Candidatus Lokiarchaeota archaeon]|nr:hypothetical protein [Candidatus Lokiarchaeota archaeon]